MKLKNMSKEELETMSYTDITYMILKENKTMNTAELFKNICNLLDLSEEEYEQSIGDYYTSLTIDKRFHMLENGEWDLTENHKVELQIDDDEELEETEEQDEEIEEPEEEQEENIDSLDSLEDELDDVDDDTLDLSIVSEEELEEEN